MKPIGTITLNTVDEALGNRSPEGLIQHPREKVSAFKARRDESNRKMYARKGRDKRGVGNVTPEGLRVPKHETIKSITARRLAARQRIARGDTGTRQ